MDAPSEPCDWEWLRVRKIQSVVATYYGIPFAHMRSHRRDTRTSRARTMAVGIARDLVGPTFQKLGQLFGGRDHSTMVVAYQRFEVLRDAKHEDVVELVKRCRHALEKQANLAPTPEPLPAAAREDPFVRELVAAGVRKPEG